MNEIILTQKEALKLIKVLETIEYIEPDLDGAKEMKQLITKKIEQSYERNNTTNNANSIHSNNDRNNNVN